MADNTDKLYTSTTTQADNASNTSSGYYPVSPTANQSADASNANTKSYSDSINSMYDMADQQVRNNLDYQYNQGINSAYRSYEDAAPSYGKQYGDATINMYQGADNSALASRMNGQYGGMATQQAGAVMTQYQQARQEISKAQEKLATDTVRQVEELRAQKKFKEADQLLQNAQRRFSALYEDAVRVDENQYSNWQYENSLQREDSQINQNIAQSDKEYQQSLGLSFLKAGVMPPQSFLDALGITSSTAQSYINMVLMGY